MRMKKIMILILAASPALADSNINGKTVECYCTDRSGSRVEMGETICLQVDGRMFMAQCQMSLNVPMWREIAEGCLSSSIGKQSQPAVDTASVDSKI